MEIFISSNWDQESGLKMQRGLSDNNGHIHVFNIIFSREEI